jgi:predicted phage terminase large subunit-like protein
MSGVISLGDALAWPTADKIKLLGRLRVELWRELARPEQQQPPGDWRTWYLMGGRGSGKSRTGAETFCDWINEWPSGEWAIVAPTFADARDTCVESASSGILPILGPAVQNWNRSLGELLLVDGTKIYLDGADDGALRIQGKNLRGAWCDEIGLWNQWDRAWNESLSFAVRHEPSKIVATGTPKMGHGLVKILVEDPQVPKSRMRTSDNLVNLNPAAVRDLYTKYGGTRLGEQELEGEWLEAIEGDMLKRAWWKFFDRDLLGTRTRPGFQVALLPKFQMILLSCDTPLKDKETSDFVALQAWGVIGADRYLLDTRVDRMSFDQAKRAIFEMSTTMRRTWKHCQHAILIENAGYGVELIIDLRRELGGIHKISPGAEGNKTMRALSASSDLETGNCFLPGKQKPDLTGPDESVGPAFMLKFVDEAALFPNGPNDDQVDAWSQAMNWLRTRSPSPMRTASGFRNVVAEAVRNPFLPSLRGGHDGRYRGP